MIFLELFSWWYGQGWIGVVRNTQKRLYNTAHMFSAGLLIQTLFSPWRRIITYPGASMQAHMQAFLDNLVSRFVGFTVRIFVLLAALVSLLVIFVASIIELVAWPLLPAAPIIFLLLGVAS